MDPFSIALGVLQLTGVTIKVSLLLQKKIKVFRNYSREVDRVLKGVDRQRKNFLHEIHLLLRLAKQSEDDIERMLQDADEPAWSSRELQAGLNAVFPRTLDTVQDIIEEIGSTLTALQGELACFDDLVWMGTKVNDEDFAKYTFGLQALMCSSAGELIIVNRMSPSKTQSVGYERK